MEARAKPGARLTPVLLSWAVALCLASPVAAQSSLKSRRDISVGHHPVGAITMDFDHDGILDVVTVDQMDDQLGMVKGFGDGTFRRVKGLAVGSLPTAGVAGDANGDGILDLITAN